MSVSAVQRGSKSPFCYAWQQIYCWVGAPQLITYCTVWITLTVLLIRRVGGNRYRIWNVAVCRRMLYGLLYPGSLRSCLWKAKFSIYGPLIIRFIGIFVSKRNHYIPWKYTQNCLLKRSVLNEINRNNKK